MLEYMSMSKGMNTSTLITAAPLLLIVCILYFIISRLFLSPISHIPGPKLAALTYLYQSYYDLYPYQGRWLFQQIALHKKYGPVVRVGPDEIHINDPDFYTEFAGTATKKRDKSATWYWFAGMSSNIGQSAFATLDHGHHALRRSGMSGFFSMAKVRELEGRVRGHVEKMTSRLLKDAGTGKVVNLMHFTSGLTLDVITEYSFGKSMGSLDTEDLGKPMRDMLENGVQIHPFARQFRWFVRPMMEFVGFASKHFGMFKEVQYFNDFFRDLTAPAWEKAHEEESDGKTAFETSIVEAMVKSETLPPDEKTRLRIEAEAGNLVGAGTETTGRTIAVGLFYIFNNPSIHQRLLAELRTLMPTSSSPLPTVAQLTTLPYLTSTIHESLRLAHGVAGRLVRISPAVPLTCNNITIPAGATFSMSHYIQHTDPRIFPEPAEFRPERYLVRKEKTEADGDVVVGGEALKYLVPFGRGPRMCLGMNLAWSEMYLAFAGVVGRVDLELWETGLRDVTVEREFFLGLFPKESKGIRVKVNGLLEK